MNNMPDKYHDLFVEIVNEKSFEELYELLSTPFPVPDLFRLDLDFSLPTEKPDIMYSQWGLQVKNPYFDTIIFKPCV